MTVRIRYLLEPGRRVRLSLRSGSGWRRAEVQGVRRPDPAPPHVGWTRAELDHVDERYFPPLGGGTDGRFRVLVRHRSVTMGPYRATIRTTGRPPGLSRFIGRRRGWGVLDVMAHQLRLPGSPL